MNSFNFFSFFKVTRNFTDTLFSRWEFWNLYSKYTAELLQSILCVVSNYSGHYSGQKVLRSLKTVLLLKSVDFKDTEKYSSKVTQSHLTGVMLGDISQKFISKEVGISVKDNSFCRS